MINNYTYRELYEMYLSRQFAEIEQIIWDSKVPELKQFAKENDLVWYQGSKESFLQALRYALIQTKIIVGDTFK